MTTRNGKPERQILLHARYFHGMGWSLVPMQMGSKLPAWKWEPLQKKRASLESLTKAFSLDSELGLGVIFGEISGGLASRDFDSMEAFSAWAAEYPSLAAELPTVATARGRHVYCRTSLESVISAREALGKRHGNGAIALGDGELRCGSGCYSVLPPSIHPSGHKYAWIVKPPKNGAKFPEIDLLEAGFTTCFVDHDTVDTEDTGLLKGYSRRTQAVERGSMKKIEKLQQWDEEAILKAIDRTIPTGPGVRHKQLFVLARELKAIFPDNVDPLDLEEHVRCWHSKAIKNINTKSFEDSWDDFLDTWGNVKFAKGEGIMTAILERADARELPKCAMRFENPKKRRLVALLRQLQQESETGTFFLSCRMAGEMVDTEYQKANRWMRIMAKHYKILEVVEQGNLKGNKATEYRYLGD